MIDISITGFFGLDIKAVLFEVMRFVGWLILLYSVWALSCMVNYAFLGIERSDVYASVVFLAVVLSAIKNWE